MVCEAEDGGGVRWASVLRRDCGAAVRSEVHGSLEAVGWAAGGRFAGISFARGQIDMADAVGGDSGVVETASERSVFGGLLSRPSLFGLSARDDGVGSSTQYGVLLWPNE